MWSGWWSGLKPPSVSLAFIIKWTPAGVWKQETDRGGLSLDHLQTDHRFAHLSLQAPKKEEIEADSLWMNACRRITASSSFLSLGSRNASGTWVPAGMTGFLLLASKRLFEKRRPVNASTGTLYVPTEAWFLEPRLKRWAQKIMPFPFHRLLASKLSWWKETTRHYCAHLSFPFLRAIEPQLVVLRRIALFWKGNDERSDEDVLTARQFSLEPSRLKPDPRHRKLHERENGKCGR